MFPPSADRRKDVSFRFEQKFVDPYAWLRDPDWQLVMQKHEKLKKDKPKDWQGNIYASETIRKILKKIQ